jgi:hypothetical protein
MIDDTMIEILNSLDSAIVGTGDQFNYTAPMLVYDYNRSIEILIRTYNYTNSQAAETIKYISREIANSNHAPIIFLKQSLGGLTFGSYKFPSPANLYDISDSTDVILQYEQEFLLEHGEAMIEGLLHAFPDKNIILTGPELSKLDETKMNEHGWYKKHD